MKQSLWGVLALLFCFTFCAAYGTSIEPNSPKYSKTPAENPCRFSPGPVCGTGFTVSSILEFEWIAGNYEWIEPSKRRLLASSLVFGYNGEFTFVLPYDASTTYYLEGSYSSNSDGGYTFEASHITSNGAASGTSIVVAGSIYAYNNQTRAILSYRSGAVYNANVNNTQMSSTVSKSFTAKVVLQ